ncbi:MAG: hypothetical protein D8M58_19345 [Calditrichaeota bacterium]|nr:MAG: hypothetical protein DWQ03_22025 [Calditrichota bacterium]MBL1207568.1 hypothetical protein [Calditrichota bacterium]NOG47400.1 hypothetical protein [Calditrichota bacterium]
MKIKMVLLIISLLIISAQAQNKNSALSYNELLVENLNSFKASEVVNKNAGYYFQSESSERKSVGLALLYSLILPGAGEFYIGNKTHGQIFLGTEILAWGSYLINDNHASSLEKDYKAYARLHAGVNGSGQDEQYWIDIGKFNDIYSFNNRRANERNVDRIYEESKSWQWDSKENRITYAHKRFDTTEIKNRDVYFFTAILVNHIVSGINAVRLARKHNKSIAQNDFNYHFVINTSVPQNNYVGIAISQSF